MRLSGCEKKVAWSSACSRTAHGLVCLVGWSFWCIWFFWMNFRSDYQTNQMDERDQMN